MSPRLRILADPAWGWSAGVRHPPEAEYPAGMFDDVQLQLLRADENLAIEELPEEGAEEDPAQIEARRQAAEERRRAAEAKRALAAEKLAAAAEAKRLADEERARKAEAKRQAAAAKKAADLG